MALIVVDTSVLIAFLDASDAHHAAAVATLAASRGDDIVLPASAYAELLVAPARHGAMAVAKVDDALSALPVRIEPLTADTARAAARMRARHRSLKLPDALVLATGDVLDAARVLTADRAWSRFSRRVRTI